jgi:tetratricopeptide (TPR) repeat protein
MLYRLLIIVLLVLAELPVDAAILKGVILANELSGSPIENVGVDAISGTNLTISDLSGKFTLEFPQRRIGDTVRIIVNKGGYVVVNDVQLETVLPVDADAAPLTVILAKEGDREEMARRFYRIKSFDAIEESYQKRLKDLKDTQQATDAALTKVQQERDQAKAAAEKASEELAKNQPGRSSELYQQAKRLFVEGKVEEAISLLDEEKLRRLDEQAKKAVENAVQPRLLKAQLLTVQLRFDDAEKAYLQAIEIAPDSFEANFDYARFNQDLKRFEKAKIAYNRCSELARKAGNDVEVALALNNLGELDREQEQTQDARRELEEALQIRRELAQESPEAYLPDLAQTLNNMANLNNQVNRTNEARREYAEALQIRRELASKNPQIFLPKVALTLNNMGVLDYHQHRMDDSRKNYEESLRIFRELAQKDSAAYLPDLAQTLINLGELDRDQNRVQEAQKDYEEALQIRRELAQKNPETYRPDVARTLNSLGILDLHQGRMEEARKEFAEALQTYRERRRLTTWHARTQLY